MNYVNVYVGSRGVGGGGGGGTELEAFCCSVCPSTRVSNIQLIVQDEEHMDEKCTLLTRDSPSPLS